MLLLPCLLFIYFITYQLDGKARSQDSDDRLPELYNKIMRYYKCNKQKNKVK